ncbi:hypothetical protein B0H14DRAFT_2780049 [Mycena olivaceomarginata]|nr:hypothetical protein B0H14DRAFT_2780049 [Mycena olivaceomarginata]
MLQDSCRASLCYSRLNDQYHSNTPRGPVKSSAPADPGVEMERDIDSPAPSNPGATSSAIGPRASGASISPCGLNCVTAAAEATECQVFTNITCTCTNRDFQFKVTSCVSGECQTTDVEAVLILLGQQCGTVDLSPTGTPTGTAPFLPFNSAADISGSPSVSSSANPVSNSTPTHPASQTPVPLPKRPRNSTRIVAIAASVAAICCFAAVTLLVLWLRRFRQRVRQRRLPEQFLQAQEQQISERRLGPGVTATADRAPQTSPVTVETENEALPNGRREEALPGVDMLNDRVRRMEVQLEALLTLGVPESSPPSYRD